MRLRVKSRLLLLSVALGAMPLAALASVTAATAVGEIQLVVGKAWIVHPDASRERARQGMTLGVSDTIETESNGHVHVRFVDDALVSVRPSSALEVLRYDYDASNPARSAVKMNLVEGVFRGISGKAAKNARDNFRLNTPIAAIGVRGTDFVVSADRDSVRALVTEGAIVVAPFSSECLAEALGPCSQNALELAGGAGQVLQLSANMPDPVLLPLNASGIPETLVGSSVQAPATQDESDEGSVNGGGLYADTVTTRAVNQTIAYTRATTGSPQTPVDPPRPEFTPDVAVATAALTADERQLVWGRYSTDATYERITVFYDPASSVLGDRVGTVGNNNYALFRIEENGNQVVKPNLGEVGFALQAAQAQYSAGGVTSLMDVNGGQLRIDFDQNRFSTSLGLSHAATGAITFTDSGRVFAGGYFHNRTETQATAGAVSLDGGEAGYFFEKSLENGVIEGLTLWGRQP